MLVVAGTGAAREDYEEETGSGRDSKKAAHARVA